MLLISLAASALMGVIALLDNDFGDTQGRLLYTSLATFGASSIILSCGLAWERGRLGLVPPGGIVSGLLGFGIVVYAIWWQPGFEDDVWARAFATEILIAVAATHLSLVSITDTGRQFRPVTLAALGLNLLAVILSLSAIWTEDVGDGFWRAYGIVMLLLIAVTIARPILNRFQPDVDETSVISTESGVAAVFCPRCGTRLPTPGQSSCPACGASFQVRIDPPDG